MRAMVLPQPAPINSAPLSEMDVPDPSPKAGEVMVRVKTCCVCRTDLHVCEGELPNVPTGIIPGHMIVGMVEKLGENAKRFKVGDRIGIAWLRYTCGQCQYCKAGNENLCPYAKFTGYTDPGGYAQFAVVPEDYAYELPNGITDEKVAPLLCAGIIGFRALRRARVQPGTAVGMYGFGSSAHIAIQIARHWNCRVHVMTRDEKHRRLALELGATSAGPSDARPPEPLQSAILFAPVGHLVLPAMEALDMGGTLAVAGIYLTDIPSLNYEKHLFHEKNLVSVTANTREDGRELLKNAAEMSVRPQTQTFPLKEANRALQLLKSDGINGSAILVVE